MEKEVINRITISRDVLHGKPHITGTRIAVYQVLDLLAAGKSVEEILSDEYFPDIEIADVRACIAYASDVIRDDLIVPSV